MTDDVSAAPGTKTYVLLGADGRPHDSTTPGQLGGYRRRKLYGRLDCPAALRAIAAGGYVKHRVFFADEATAVAAGYRPCAVCLPDAYQKWRTHDPQRITPHRSSDVRVAANPGTSAGPPPALHPATSPAHDRRDHLAMLMRDAVTDLRTALI